MLCKCQRCRGELEFGNLLLLDPAPQPHTWQVCVNPHSFHSEGVWGDVQATNLFQYLPFACQKPHPRWLGIKYHTYNKNIKTQLQNNMEAKYNQKDLAWRVKDHFKSPIFKSSWSSNRKEALWASPGRNSKGEATTEKAPSLLPTNLAPFNGGMQRRPSPEDLNAHAEIWMGFSGKCLPPSSHTLPVLLVVC